MRYIALKSFTSNNISAYEGEQLNLSDELGKALENDGFVYFYPVVKNKISYFKPETELSSRRLSYSDVLGYESQEEFLQNPPEVLVYSNEDENTVERCEFFSWSYAAGAEYGSVNRTIYSYVHTSSGGSSVDPVEIWIDESAN